MAFGSHTIFEMQKLDADKLFQSLAAIYAPFSLVLLCNLKYFQWLFSMAAYMIAMLGFHLPALVALDLGG